MESVLRPPPGTEMFTDVVLQSGKAGRNLGFHREGLNKERAQETTPSEETKTQSRAQ